MGAGTSGLSLRGVATFHWSRLKRGLFLYHHEFNEFTMSLSHLCFLPMSSPPIAQLSSTPFIITIIPVNDSLNGRGAVDEGSYDERDVLSAYRKASLWAHPDKGGKQKDRNGLKKSIILENESDKFPS